jgi:hypothetical protein
MPVAVATERRKKVALYISIIDAVVYNNSLLNKGNNHAYT